MVAEDDDEEKASNCAGAMALKNSMGSVLLTFSRVRGRDQKLIAQDQK